MIVLKHKSDFFKRQISSEVQLAAGRQGLTGGSAIFAVNTEV